MKHSVPEAVLVSDGPDRERDGVIPYDDRRIAIIDGLDREVASTTIGEFLAANDDADAITAVALALAGGRHPIDSDVLGRLWIELDLMEPR